MTEYNIEGCSIVLLNESDKRFDVMFGKFKKEDDILTYCDFRLPSMDKVRRSDYVIYIDENLQYKVLKNRFDDDFCSCLIQNEIRSKRLKEILYDK